MLGENPIRALGGLVYSVTRQTGSHIRLTTNERGEHHLTIPNHDPIKIGTLSAILGDVAGHFGLNRDEVAAKLSMS